MTERSLAGVFVALFALFAPSLSLWAQDQQTALQQIPNLKALPDLTEELQQQIAASQGNLKLNGRKFYRITAPLEFDLTKLGAIQIQADQGATLLMDGPGPALRLTGSHEGTASPKSFQPATWNERMPLIDGLEILGVHPEADGIELVKCVAPTITRVSIRWCRHGIHLVNRNRNVVIAECHLYENSGVGVFLDDVNLHQINVNDCHISYNRQGGIVVRDGNVRNLQVCGCDIEGNMPGDQTPTDTANILIDVSGSAGDRSKSIAEVSITGCTIQHSANYGGQHSRTIAAGGANIRLRGKPVYPIDSVTISGNVLSDTTTNIDIDHAMDIVINANNFFAPKPANLTVANSNRVVVTGNTFNPRQFERPGTIRFVKSNDCVVSGNTLHRFATEQGALILDGCRGCLITANLLSECASGIVLRKCQDTTVSNCRINNLPRAQLGVSPDGDSSNLTLEGNVTTVRSVEDTSEETSPQ